MRFGDSLYAAESNGGRIARCPALESDQHPLPGSPERREQFVLGYDRHDWPLSQPERRRRPKSNGDDALHHDSPETSLQVPSTPQSSQHREVASLEPCGRIRYRLIPAVDTQGASPYPSEPRNREVPRRDDARDSGTESDVCWRSQIAGVRRLSENLWRSPPVLDLPLPPASRPPVPAYFPRQSSSEHEVPSAHLSALLALR